MATLLPLLSKPALRCWSSPWVSAQHCRTPPFSSAAPASWLGRCVAMFVVMPVTALILARAFHLHPAVKIALVALALSPLPPTFPRKAIKQGGGALLCGRAPGRGDTRCRAAHSVVARADRTQPAHAPADAARRGAGAGILVAPAAAGAGMVVRKVAPAFAQRAAGPISTIAFAVLALGVIPILSGYGPQWSAW